MSYKSLLFCADEKTARLVTQVLSELDFTVELAVDTYLTAKRLAEQHFDALVVDCQSEQDASLLFKAARNSTENHSSLSVAVVEGQAGVAKAFRIGANLVLTKPINVEQSKGTLRVARGLLKKNQPKGAEAGASAPASTFAASTSKPVIPGAPAFSSVGSSLPPAFTPVQPTAAAAHASTPNVPYAGLEVEKEPTPVPEAADVAVLESLPQLPKTKISEPTAMPFKAVDKPFVVGGSAAAAAPAVEKKIVEHHATSSSPLITNEPIVRDAHSQVALETHTGVPTFSTLDTRAKESSGGGKGFLKLVVGLALLGVAFYLGWQKLPALLHRNSTSSQTAVTQVPSSEKSEAAQPDAATQPSPPIAQRPTSNSSASANDSTVAPEQIAAAAAATSMQPTSPAENIELQEMPISRDAKVIVTPRAQPLIVKNNSAKHSSQTAVAAAPSVDITAGSSNSPIADLVTSDAPLPKPAPGTVRISQGVSQGLLIKKVAPVYPQMAVQLHRGGTVEMLATVSKDGNITNVRVLSGDAMLAKAAVSAVKQWRYRPYLLNGQPLEVETQITISFKAPLQ